MHNTLAVQSANENQFFVQQSEWSITYWSAGCQPPPPRLLSTPHPPPHPHPVRDKLAACINFDWFSLCSWVKRLYQLFWTWSHYNVFDIFFFFHSNIFSSFFFFALERHHGIQQSAEVKCSNTVAFLLWFTLHSKPAREKTSTQFTLRLRRRKWAGYFVLGHPEPSLTTVVV